MYKSYLSPVRFNEMMIVFAKRCKERNIPRTSVLAHIFTVYSHGKIS